MKDTTFSEKITLAGIIFVFALIVVTVSFGIKRENEELYSDSSLEFTTYESTAASSDTDSSKQSPSFDSTSSASSETAENNLININEASVSELCDLPGIGEKKAAAIVEYRDLSGKFKTKEEIKNVSGIGDVTYEKLKDLITVD